MPYPLRDSRRNMLQPLALACLALAAGAALAEESPYYIGASLGVTHESNVFRRALAESDTITSGGLLGGIDQSFGRQRVFANGTVNANRFRNHDQLNNVSYGLSSGLDWQTIEHLSGTLRYSTNQRLANYGETTAPNINEKDVERTQQLVASVRYGISSAFALEGSVERRTVSFSAATDTRDYSQRVGSFGVRWGGTGIVTVGIGVRQTRGDYSGSGDQTSRRDIDLTATWQPSGFSQLNGRLSSSRETHSVVKDSEFSGLTGSLGWTYRPSPRTSINALLSRDTGSETTFYTFATPAPNVPPTVIGVDTSRITTALQLGATYELTAKIGLSGSLRHSRNSSVNSGSTGHDTLNVYALGASYQPTRSVGLSCHVSHDNRSTEVAVSTYSANTLGCSAQVTLR
jgi:hypothetical protein